MDGSQAGSREEGAIAFPLALRCSVEHPVTFRQDCWGRVFVSRDPLDLILASNAATSAQRALQAVRSALRSRSRASSSSRPVRLALPLLKCLRDTGAGLGQLLACYGSDIMIVHDGGTDVGELFAAATKGLGIAAEAHPVIDEEWQRQGERACRTGPGIVHKAKKPVTSQ